MQNKKGLFIAIEGSEASGKTTQVIRLYERITKEYPMTSLVRSVEPAPNVRDSVTQAGIDNLTRLLFVAAGRRDTHTRFIKPRMLQGGIALTDRYFLSTLVYQHEWSELAWWLHTSITDNLHPDLTIVLDCPAEVARERLRTRPYLDELENVPASELERRNAQFVAIGEALYEATVIDGTLPEEEVADEIWKTVSPILDEYHAE